MQGYAKVELVFDTAGDTVVSKNHTPVPDGVRSRPTQQQSAAGVADRVSAKMIAWMKEAWCRLCGMVLLTRPISSCSSHVAVLASKLSKIASAR